MMTATDRLGVVATEETVELVRKPGGRTVAVLDPQEATQLASVLNLAAHSFKRGEEEGREA